MAGEQNTAEKQNDIRREVKRRQSRGTKKHKETSKDETFDFKYHVSGKFSEDTKKVIHKRFMSTPEEPVTGEWFRNLIKGTSVIVDIIDSPIAQVEITSTGIKSIGGFDIDLYSVTVYTAGGYGVKFKTLKGQQKVIVV